MQEINDQVTNPADPDGTLTADEWNDGMKKEVQALIPQTGQTFNQADQTQLGKAIATYAAGGDFYTAGGTADAITLAPVGSKVSPNAYFDGMRVRFIGAFNNTTATTINVNSIGVVSITAGGAAITAGVISPGKEIILAYSSSTGTFEISTPSRVIIGEDTNVVTGQGFVSPLQVNGIDGRSGSASFLRASADATGFNLSLNKSRAASIGSLAAVQSGDSLGNLVYSGDDGLDYSNIGGIISVEAVGAPSGGVVPADIKFKQDVGSSTTTNWIMDQATRALLPNADGVQDFGSATNRGQDAWFTNGTIQTSDQYDKNKALPIDDNLLDALAPLAIKQWKWLSAIEEKGDDARIHIGPITQEAVTLCKNAGIDISRYAFWCKDTVPAEYEDVPVYNDVQKTEVKTIDIEQVFIEDGKPVARKKPSKVNVPVFKQEQVVNEKGKPLYLDEKGNKTTKKTETQVVFDVPVMESKATELKREPVRGKDGKVITRELQGFRKEQLLFLMLAIVNRRLEKLEALNA